MELRHYLSLLRSRRFFILAIVAIAAAGAWVATPKGATYSTQSTLYVGSRAIDDSPTAGELNTSRLAAIEQISRTFTIMIDSRAIAEKAIELSGTALSADQVVARTSAESVPGTQLIYIRVDDSDPERAQTLSNALADAFVEAVQEVEPPSEGVVPTLPAYVFERARFPTVPQPIGTARNLFVAAMFGLVSAVGLVLLLDYLDLTIRNNEDAERKLGLPVLGAIPKLGYRLPLRPVSSGRSGPR